MAASPNKSKDSATVAAFVLIAVVLFIAFGSSSPNGPAPTPGPPATTLEAATVAVIAGQSVGYAEAFAAAADQVGETITTEQELLEYLAQRTKFVREASKATFDEQLELALPFEGEIPPEHYEYVKSVLIRVSKSFAKGR